MAAGRKGRNKLDTGWRSSSRFVAVAVGVIAGVSLVTPVVPFWAAVWVAVATVVYLWPSPTSERYRPLTKPFARSIRVFSIRNHVWHPFSWHPWRLGAEGDNNGDYGNPLEEHPEQLPKMRARRRKRAGIEEPAAEERPKRRWSRRRADKPDTDVADAEELSDHDAGESEDEPKRNFSIKRLFTVNRVVAVNTLGATLVAIASVGIERTLAAAVAHIDWALLTGGNPRVTPVSDWLSQGRGIWLQVAAAPMGWAAAKSVSSWRRMQVSAKLSPDEPLNWEKPENSAPTAMAVNPLASPGSPTLGATLHTGRFVACVVLGLAGGIGVAYAAAAQIGFGWLAPLVCTAAPLGLLLGGRAAFRPWVKEQQAPWIEWQKLINEWQQHWGAVLGVNRTPPRLVSYMLRPLERPGDEEPWPPMVRQLVFALDVGVSYKTVYRHADELKAAVECDLMHIMPGVDPGTREPTWSYVDIRHELPALGEWADERRGKWEDWSFPWNVTLERQTAYHDPTLHQDVRGFLFYRQLGRAMESLKIGTLLSLRAPSLRSDEGAFPAYLRFEVPLHGKTTFNALKEKQHELAKEMRAAWLRFEPLSVNNIAIGHICAVRPDDKTFEATFSDRQAAKIASRDVMRLDWHWCMHTAKLFGDDGISTPVLERVKVVNYREGDPEAEIQQITFRLPQGLSAVDIQRETDQLAADSNFPYVAVEPTDLPSKVTVLAGRKDPLDDAYLFNEYASRPVVNGAPMLIRPTRGEPRIEWCVGIGSDGSPRVFEWDHEEAHLLIAGSTGSGKSMVVNSMLVQLLINNDPEDVELWLMEPKNELGRYAHKPHTRVFVDQHVAEGSIYHVAARTFEALVAEMERRYALMNQHPKQPQKISEARLIARTEEGAEHLNFRYIIVVVEECASYFRKPGSGDRDHMRDWKAMMGQAIEIAQKSRASGIHMVTATQNPTIDAAPMPIKSNQRRLGLRVNKTDRSMVIIDQPGLEKISKPGRGMMTGPNGGYVGYRAFFLRGSEDVESGDGQGDLAAHLARIPDDDRWPKLPPGVEPATDGEVALTPQVN